MQFAITFDFHNTLIRCDPWFDLEVAGLPGQVADELARTGHAPLTEDQRAAVTDSYRALRSEIIGHGIEMDATEGVIETFDRIGYSADIPAVSRIVDSLFRPLVAISEVVDGVPETLAYLAHQGVAIGVVSSAVHHDYLEWALAHHGLRRYFADVFTSASTGFYKSRPEIYHVACDRMGVEPERMIHVGDSFRFDHLGGTAAGLRTVWLNETGADRPDGAPPPALELPTLVGAGPKLHRLLLAAADAR